jgi:hypothetical protein
VKSLLEELLRQRVVVEANIGLEQQLVVEHIELVVVERIELVVVERIELVVGQLEVVEHIGRVVEHIGQVVGQLVVEQLAEREGELLVFRQLGIQLFPGLFQLEHIQCKCHDRPGEYILFDVQLYSNRLLFFLLQHNRLFERLHIPRRFFHKELVLFK